MKNVFGVLLMSLLALTFACNSEAPTQEDTTEETASDEHMDESAEAMEVKTESESYGTEQYQTTVLKSDIPSPRKETKGTIGETEVTINYGSPSVKGRTIWGDLVPYGQVWRTGANEVTTIEFSSDVMVEGESLSAGKYGLFTIPGEDKWTIVFNENGEMWGAGDYDEAKDALRVEVSPEMVEEVQETMEFQLEEGNLVLRWDKAHVAVAVSPAS